MSAPSPRAQLQQRLRSARDEEDRAAAERGAASARLRAAQLELDQVIPPPPPSNYISAPRH